MNLPESKQIIIFDGVCNLCNASVQFIIKNDKNDLFRFASNQSEIGQEIIRINKIDIQAIDSIILFNPVKGVSTESEAAFKIAKELRGLYHYMYFFIYLPRSFTYYCYKFIAKNRYKWFGKKDQCALPTPFLQAKFLS
jgi:predicted DCC family thiol-disulfide oxidoreductase YuxK